MFDFLHTIDWINPQPRASSERLSRVFGLPPVQPAWTQTLPSHGYEATFFRAGDHLAASPTRLEFVTAVECVGGTECSIAPIALVDSWQPHRPQRTHATVVCVADFERCVALVVERGAPVRIEPPCEHLPHPRAWVGWESETCRVPGYDAGLILEFIPTAALGGRVVASVTDPPSPPSSWLDRRVHLVADLDGAVSVLGRIAGMVPARVSVDPLLGARVARYEFDHAYSAALELAEPLESGFASDYFDKWGEGPLVTTIGTTDAQTLLRNAQDLGATVEHLEDRGRSMSIVSDEMLPGVLIEVVALPHPRSHE